MATISSSEKPGLRPNEMRRQPLQYVGVVTAALAVAAAGFDQAFFLIKRRVDEGSPDAFATSAISMINFSNLVFDFKST